MSDLHIYPIGKFKNPPDYNAADFKQHIERIGMLPSKLKNAVEGLNDDQLSHSYREGGWNIKQIVHHIADSHLNAMIRTKLMLTESEPVIKPYDQDTWANLADGKNAPVSLSLPLIDALHNKWHWLLENLGEEDAEKIYVHPEYNRTFKLYEVLALYAWHGDHHVGQIEGIVTRNGW